ncbi:FAD synthetase family protein [Neobacillus niacini]|uniref:FAD synthetase family protein n=1 Tax=Neobacillus niacini TaxID=86668 RepID=UPI00203EC016|nr:FAD synthetase family protein [Neobacillus niacini]MCM3690795.1 FAD synthetase family protein [Neobacillus niacini]
MEFIHVTSNNREQTLLRTKPCVMALGFFDGVHLGHQKVIKEAKRVSEEQELPLVIMSFFPHPKEVLSNGKKIIPYLMPMKDKRRIFEELGVDSFYLIQFTKKFARLSPREFVHTYLLDFGAKQVVAGFDFTYGHRGEGNMDTMKRDSDGKIEGVKVDRIEWEGEKISSTLIRQLVFAGELERIPSYLGNEYQSEGRIIFRKKHVEVVLHPYYLMPASGWYEVTVNLHQEATTQIAVVHEGRLTLLSPQGGVFPFYEWESVRLSWKKVLPKGFVQQVNSKQVLSSSIGVYEEIYLFQ